MLSLGGALFCLVLLICIARPQSIGAHQLAHLIPAPDVYQTDFDEILERAQKSPRPLRGALYRLAEDRDLRELQAAPFRTGAWLNLAYVRLLKDGRWSSDAARAFDQSFAVAPIDPGVAKWRLHFALEIWPALSIREQNLTMQELTAMWKYGAQAQQQLVDATLTTSNVAGRATGEAYLSALGWPGRPGGTAPSIPLKGSTG